MWDGKPGAVVSVSPGAIGAFGANHHLRQPLVFLNVLCLQMPEVYIGDAANRFDATGALSHKSTREFFQKFMTAYAELVERFESRRPSSQEVTARTEVNLFE